jgi:alkaline phosphatase D
MSRIGRRTFIEMAVAMGATAAWGEAFAAPSRVAWKERRDLYGEGVASADPHSDSVLLWTRRAPVTPVTEGGGSTGRLGVAGLVQTLAVEVAEDQGFARVVATAQAPISADSDWTCRVLVGGLKASRVYWYRFTDANGNGSRIGRTITAPAENDGRRVAFTFVSCQNVNYGAQNAYRRMIFEDERAAEKDRLGFVLHLGDFIYELVWYPEEAPEMYDRRVRDIVRYAHGEKIDDFHIPTTVDDYRAIYRAYLHDPDLQDARARWPFVNMWDNHEYSWLGWQGLQKFDGTNRPAQTRKVAANQAFFEYQPARMKKPSGASLERFDGPKVVDAAITRFDDHGLGLEPNNLAAIRSLTGYRTLRWGKHMDLIVTDQRSYRSEDPSDRAEAKAFVSRDFPEFFPEEAMQVLDGGREFNGGRPPESIRYGGKDVLNFRKNEPAQTILGAEQKAWFLEQLKSSRATWKVWGNTTGTLDFRADPQNLPGGLTKPWPGAGYAGFGGGDHGSAYVERGEIYDFVRHQGITGFATIAGDRHSFWAGLAAKTLPPGKFEPVGIAFVTGSISAPGLVEALEHKFPKDNPLRVLFVGQGPQDSRPQPTVNLLLMRGVRACLEYAKSGDIAKARGATNAELSPHLSFVDMGGHGYTVVRADGETFETEFVCIPRPVERSSREDGGALAYRVVHSARLWKSGERPRLEQKIVEGEPRFSV